MDNFADIKNSLEEKLNTLTKRLKNIDADLNETNDDDWAENAVESEGDEVLEKIGHMAEDSIEQINLALARIEAGTYGICGNCKKAIPIKRLQALPYTSTCLACSQVE